MPSFLTPLQKVPVVKDKPKDVTVKEGEQAMFECCVLSMPPPLITWYFMGRPIADGEIYTLTEDEEDGRYSLLIPEAFPEDAGVYTVRATNALGMAEASAILTVEG